MSSKWSVRLALEANEGGPISLELRRLLVYEVRGLRLTGPAGAYDDGADVITIELEAEDEHHARILAQHLLSKARSAAGLPMQQARVVWVTPMLNTVESSHRFLDRARDLLEADDGYDLAVVAAQIHLEIQVKVLVERAVADDASLLKHVLIDQRHTWAPHDRLVQLVLRALFGIQVTAYPQWQRYRTHLTRRNDIAHRGQDVDRQAAEESIEVVEGLWLWLNQMASQPRRPSEAR